MWVGFSTSVRGGGSGCVCSGIDSSAWLIFFFFFTMGCSGGGGCCVGRSG